MNDWTRFWEERYSAQDYVYGKEPNAFLQETLPYINPVGRILFPAEGEGRNAVYAAELGWEVFAFDISQEGRKKAIRLAQEKDVSIQYEVGNFLELPMSNLIFDVVAMIYNHFNPKYAALYHAKFSEQTRVGGSLILEGFSEKNLAIRVKNPDIGGPTSLENLYSLDKVRNYFPDYETQLLQESEVILSEGSYHNGIGSVIRFIGKKK